ncbi:MAG: VWA domain-containing protein [Deltaproteobacteria bacterium]|nr:VWA domain-containing protein [Deltaproteobacteria bacterium]
MRDLIYSVDKWTTYLWRGLVRDSAVVREHVDRGRAKLATFPSFAREVFARLYSPPKPCLRTRPEDDWAKVLHAALDELPAFKKLAAHCAHNKELASAATANLLEQLVERLPDPPAPLDDPDARRREVRGLLDFLAALNANDPARAPLEQQIEEAKAHGHDAVDVMARFTDALDPDALRQALRRSVDDCATEVEEITSAAAGLSGLGGVHTSSDATQALLANTLKDSDALKRLGLLAGRMRRIAMGKRRTRTRHAASELSDVTNGSDLARVLPHELLKLTDPVLALDFLRAFVEGALLQYELVGNEREGRGPMVVLIDDSDSMDGPPATFARAAALALADLALTERRACRLVRFSHKINAVLDLRVGRDSAKELLAFLSGPVGGGTSFEMPLRAAREAIEREPAYERADVVLITDGEAELSPEFLREWTQRARREGLTTYAIHIGAHAPAVLRALTHEVTGLPALDPERLAAGLFDRITSPPRA